jgi:hypothetical protein
MAASLQKQVLGWVLDEISKQRFGEEFGADVSWGAVQVPAQGGARMVPSWLLLLTARNPVLGEGPLYHLAPLGLTPVPEQAAVRAAVTRGLKMLRDLAASKLTVGNGHPPALAGGRG